MTIKLQTIVFLCAMILLTSCIGQTSSKNSTSDQSIKEWAKGDTLPEFGNNIMVIYQDKSNTYWFGSWDSGVYTFDGKTIVNYTTKHGLANNRIDEIKEDKLGNIYFTSCHPTSNIVKFDGKTFTELMPTKSDDWQLQKDDVWFRSTFRSENVFRYDGNRLYEFQLPKPTNLSNPFEIYSIYKDTKGNMWFGTNPSGVCRYNGESFDWITEEDVTEFRNEGANGVRSVAEDKNGDFWFNTEYRYSIYDSTTIKSPGFYRRHKSIGGLDGMTDSNLDEYLSTVRDNDNNLWFVTYLDGVWKYDGTKITHYPVQDNSKNISLFCIYKDNEGTLWLGTHENGVYTFNGTEFERYIVNERL